MDSLKGKTRTVDEMDKTMMNDSKFDNKFWVQEVDTVVYILNRGLLRSNCDKTLYELWR